MKKPSISYKNSEKLATFFRFFQKNSEKGSILLEIAIGISVLAVISGFVIRKTMTANKYMREQLTKSNIETITILLASFVANNKRLPQPSEVNDGIESDFFNDLPTIKFGYVPYKTLGIPSTVAKDGNGQPLIYIVEPALTANYSKIYGNDFDEKTFCSNIPLPKISIQGSSKNDVIAFVIDTKNHKNSLGENIIIRPTAHTFWVTRDVLLMKYLKNSPCRIENFQQNSDRHLHGFNDDF